MKRRLLASLAGLFLLVPAGAGATSVGLPIVYHGGPYFVGFEVESMEDVVGDENLASTRYLGRISMRVSEPLVLSLRLGGSAIDVESRIHDAPVTFEGKPKLAAGFGAGYHTPLLWGRIGLFGDAGLLYSLSTGRTSFTTTVQSSTFHEEYENRYRWIEYQAGGGARCALPFGEAHAGLLLRAVDGKVWRETYQTGALISSSEGDFSRSADLFLIGGIDIPLPGRLVLSFGGGAAGGDQYSWTVAIGEVSR